MRSCADEIGPIQKRIIEQHSGRKIRSPGRGVGGRGRPGPDPEMFPRMGSRYSITDQQNKYAVGRPCATVYHVNVRDVHCVDQKAVGLTQERIAEIP